MCIRDRDIDRSSTVDAVWAEIDKTLLGLHPLHNRRIELLNKKTNKDEEHSRFLTRLIEEASIAEMTDISTESLILHLFCHVTAGLGNSDVGKPIRKLILENLRVTPNLTELGSTIAAIKGFEADNRSCNAGGARPPHAARRAGQPGGKYYICDSSDHLRFSCPVRCEHCNKKGHKSKDCYSLNPPPSRGDSRPDRRDQGHGESRDKDKNRSRRARTRSDSRGKDKKGQQKQVY